MKENKVLPVVYGIALFAVLIGAVELLYNSVEMFRSTSLGSTLNIDIRLFKEFYDFQKPIAISLLLAAIFAIVGVVGGTGYIFAKKRVFKIVFFVCIAIALIALLATLLFVSSIWNTFAKETLIKAEGVYIVKSELSTTCYALYTTSMGSLIQNLICFAVIFAIALLDCVKMFISRFKNNKAEEISDNITETVNENTEEI